MSDNQALPRFVKECISDREQLLTMVKLMREKRLGIGSPVTIPDRVNEATVAFIAHLENSVRELDVVLEAYGVKPNA